MERQVLATSSGDLKSVCPQRAMAGASCGPIPVLGTPAESRPLAPIVTDVLRLPLQALPHLLAFLYSGQGTSGPAHVQPII